MPKQTTHANSVTPGDPMIADEPHPNIITTPYTPLHHFRKVAKPYFILTWFSHVLTLACFTPFGHVVVLISLYTKVELMCACVRLYPMTFNFLSN